MKESNRRDGESSQMSPMFQATGQAVGMQEEAKSPFQKLKSPVQHERSLEVVTPTLATGRKLKLKTNNPSGSSRELVSQCKLLSPKLERWAGRHRESQATRGETITGTNSGPLLPSISCLTSNKKIIRHTKKPKTQVLRDRTSTRTRLTYGRDTEITRSGFKTT